MTRLAGEPLVVVTGGKGRLAHAVVPEFRRRGWAVAALGHDELDVTKRDVVFEIVTTMRPDAVVNLAAWTDVEGCERDRLRADAVNAEAVRHVAEAGLATGAHVCHVSSDYVFDGKRSRPYRESDAARPISAYGRSKLAGEFEAGPDATVIRVGWLAGVFGRSLVRTILDQATDPSGVLRYVTDQVGSPTMTEHAARALVDLVTERRSGLFHVASEGEASCHELARFVLAAAGDQPDRVVPVVTTELAPAQQAARPAYSVLDGSKLRRVGVGLPPWQDAVGELVRRLCAERAHIVRAV